jgi:hypothetical protein
MPKGPGFWLEQNGNFHRVTRHEDFIKDPYRGFQFSPEIEKEIKQTEGEDELRIIGIKAGLIRTRKHVNSYISVQFFTDPQNVEDFLKSVLKFCQETDINKNEDLKVDNLKTGDTAILTLEKFAIRLTNEKNVFED